MNLLNPSTTMLNPDLVQLILANQANNINLWNPPNYLIGQNPILPTPLPLPQSVPQPFQFVTPFPTYQLTSVVPSTLPVTPLPIQPTVSIEEPVIKTEPCDHQPSTSTSIPEDPFEMGSIPISTYYPTHFMRGTQLHVTNGDIKKVEDLSSDDFLKCAAESDDVLVNASIVRTIKINSAGSVTIVFETGTERQQVSLKCQIEHPFFVLGKGWSSCNPRKSGENYGLDCENLQVDDVCIVLTRKESDENLCVDIVSAERDLELFSRRAALREQLIETYYEQISGRLSAPPERILTQPPAFYRQRHFSE
uniref:AXH domain-containing protein n=1 Tax=Caenorhabditis tropicalis TaxID=1561998 RepID=A0A1I7UXM8_9PELO